MNMIEQFEETLKNSDDSRRKLIYILPALLIGFVLMALIYPDADNEINQQKIIQRDLISKLQKNSIARLEQQIKINESRILKLKDQIYKVNDNIIQIEEKLKELDFIFYDDLGFANNIEKTLRSSKELNLTINYLKTTEPKKQKSDSLIKLIKKVEIDGGGNFANIVSFIQFIEGVNTLHDFEHLVIEIEKKKEDKDKDKNIEGKKIKTNKKINIFFNFKINQYGVEL